MAEKRCNGCGEQNTIPFVAFEASEQRHERKERNFFIIILVLVGMLVLSNLAWLVYNSQFDIVEETEVVTQENENGVNNYIGEDGEIVNGETDD